MRLVTVMTFILIGFSLGLLSANHIASASAESASETRNFERCSAIHSFGNELKSTHSARNREVQL